METKILEVMRRFNSSLVFDGASGSEVGVYPEYFKKITEDISDMLLK